MGVVHASRGSLPPASPDLLSEVEIVCRIAQARSTRRRRRAGLGDRRLGRFAARPRRDPRRDQSGHSGLRRLQREDRGARWVHASARATRRCAPFRHRRRAGALHRQRTDLSPPPRPARCCSRPCAATTSTTPRSTASTTAIAVSTAGAVSCSSAAADLVARGPERRRRGRSALDRRRRRAARSRPASGSSTTRPRRDRAPPTTPRPTCSCPCTASARPAPRRSSRSPSNCSPRPDQLSRWCQAPT